MFVVSKYVTAVRGVVFNVFKLSVLPQSCPELTNVEWVWDVSGLKLEYWIFTLVNFPLPFSRLSFPFHSDVGCWMVFVVSNYVTAVMDVVCSTFLSFLSFLTRVLS